MPKVNKRKKEEKEDDSSSDSGPEDLEPAKKATKPSNDGDSTVKKTGETGKGARFELSKNKIVTVSTFKNRLQVDIREYYLDQKGALMPGRKGITLNPVQWEELKGIMADVDAALLEQI